MTQTALKVLIVEDSEFDARILVNVLRAGGYAVAYRRVDTAEAMLAALKESDWDVILADYSMPEFSMNEALQLVHQSGLDLPFIIVSGGIGEDTAVAAMKAGVHDYLMKGNLARLVPAVERELREAGIRAARRQAEKDLRESELRYRSLWETSTDAVFILDTLGQIHFANPAVATVFGYRLEEIAGLNISTLIPQWKSFKPDHDGIEAETNHCLPPKGTALETTGRRRDGHGLQVEIVCSQMDLRGQPRLVVFVRDVTERKKAEAELRQNQEQFQVARNIQQRLFPKTSPVIPGFDIAGASFPAEATGGDYFDYLPMADGTIGIVVGDVTGHGIGPALLMAETRAYLRILARNRRDLGQILTLANEMLAEDVSYERFVTLTLVKLDPATRSLLHISAGHPPGYVLGLNGQVKHVLKRTGGPLGLSPGEQCEVGPQIILDPEDLVLLLTDGAEEALSPDDEFFGLERLFEVVRAHQDQPASAIVEALYRAVRDFSQNSPQLDDVTAVVIKVTA